MRKILNNIYTGLSGRKWLKGDLHIHTSISKDGRMSRRQALDTLHTHGFDFCAISDHDAFDPGGEENGVLVLPGSEFSSKKGHLLALLTDRPLERDETGPVQQQIDAIRDAGGLPILAHPKIKELTLDQSMAYTSEQLLCKLSGYHGMEIYNHNVGSGFTTAVDRLDAVWTGRIDADAGGLPVWGYASSDAHAPEHISPNVGILVDAKDCTPAAIRTALEAGRFYSLADTMARFEEIAVDEQYLHVRAAGAVMLRLECSGGTPAEGRGNRRLAGIKIAATDTIEMKYAIQGHEGYIRIEAMDRNGHFAYSNPISI